MEDEFIAAIAYGVRRYYKHRDDSPSDAAIIKMSESIAEQSWSIFCENLIFDEE